MRCESVVVQWGLARRFVMEWEELFTYSGNHNQMPASSAKRLFYGTVSTCSELIVGLRTQLTCKVSSHGFSLVLHYVVFITRLPIIEAFIPISRIQMKGLQDDYSQNFGQIQHSERYDLIVSRPMDQKMTLRRESVSFSGRRTSGNSGSTLIKWQKEQGGCALGILYRKSFKFLCVT